MRKLLFLIALVVFILLSPPTNAQQDTLFLIKRQKGNREIIAVTDTGKLKFYDINDSFLFTADEKGNYCLLNLTANNMTKGRIKPKKHRRLNPNSFSEFRGNTSHIGNTKSNEISEFHVDERINYYYGSTVGDILKLQYIPKYNAVLLHILIYKDPELHKLQLFPCFAIKKGKYDYINVPTLVTTPTSLYESKNISTIRVHEESARTAFLANDSVLVVFDLKNTTHRNDFYNFGNGFDFRFYNGDSIFIIQSGGKALMLSLSNHQSRPVYSTEYLAGMQNFQVVGQYLFCTKGNTLYINQIMDCLQSVESNEVVSKCVQPVEEHSFSSKIISYKVSKDGTRILIHAK